MIRLDGLPLEIIVPAFVHAIGSQGIVNAADVPVILRNVKSWSCTDKAFHEWIDSDEMMHSIFQELVAKFHYPYETFALLWNTPKSRKWVRASSSYQSTLALCKLIPSIAQEISPSLLDQSISLAPQKLVVKEGFRLALKAHSVKIDTLFGKLCFHLNLQEDEYPRFYMKLITLLGGKFAGVSHSIALSEFVISKETQEIQCTQILDFEEKIGSNHLILSRFVKLSSFYHVTHIGEQPIPTQRKYHLSDKAIGFQTMHDAISQMCCESKPLFNCVRSFLPPPTEQSFVCNSVTDFAEEWAIPWIHHVEKILIANPSECSLTIKISNPQETLALHALNTRSYIFLNHSVIWPMDTTLWEDDAIEAELNRNRCSYELLQKKYEEILNQLGQGWICSQLQDYPSIGVRESEEDYQLFVKEKLFFDEADLMRFVVSHLALSSCMTFGTKMKGINQTMYLWIRKDRLEGVRLALNMEDIQ